MRDGYLIRYMQRTEHQDIRQAIRAAAQAYAPYSGFHVGAVLVAVAAGCREFVKIVIAADTKEPVSPCGACRQVLAEFNPDLQVVLANFHGKVERFRLRELLPRPSKGILGRG